MNGQFIGDNGDGTVSFDDGFGNAIRLPKDNPMAQGLMPPTPPPQVQASPMAPPMEMAPPPPMGPGADANMAAMNPPSAAPVAAPQEQAAPFVAKDAKGRPLKGVKKMEAEAQHKTDEADSLAMGAMDQAKAATLTQADTDAKEQLQIADEAAKRDQDIAVMRQQREVEKVRELEEKNSLGNGITAAVDARKSWRMDRGRLLKQMDGGDKALGILSMVLGAFSQAQNNSGSNPAMDFLMKRIDQDATDQMQEYDQLGENVAESKSAYKDYLGELKDKDAALAATKADRIEDYKGKLEMIAARSSSERVKTQATMAIAQLDQQKSTLIGRTAEQMWGRVESTKQRAVQYSQQKESKRQFDLTFKEGQDRWAAELQMKSDALKAEGKTTEAKALEEERKLGIGGLDGTAVKNKDGSTFKARSPESAIEIAKHAAATYGIADLATQLEEGYNKYGSEFTKTDGYRQLKSKHAQIQIELKEAFKLGVLAGPDLELINNAIGTSDPTELRSYVGSLRGLADNSVKRLETRMRADGFTGKVVVPTAASFAPSENSEFKPMFDTVADRSEPGTRRPARIPHNEQWAGGKETDEIKRSRAIAEGKTLSKPAQAALDSAVQIIQSPKASESQKRSAAEALRTVVGNKDMPMAARQYAEQGMRAYEGWEK